MGRSTTKITLLAALTLLLSACGGKNSSYSMLASSQSFKQSIQDNRVDVLWVVDNSGSMAPSQSNLANNFPSFITDFQTTGFDFKIAVTTSDAYMALPVWTPYYNQTPRPAVFQGKPQAEMAKFRDGLGSNHSSFFVIDPLTPSINSVFMTNVLQGTSGSGDERTLQAMKTTLDSSLNTGFLRPGAFLAVVILTDEDDFSHDGTAFLDAQYNNPALHTPQSYVDYLDGLTGTTGAARRYTVNSVSINDTACAASLGGDVRKVAQRVQSVVTATGGIKANLCGNFATELKSLAEGIISLATQFYLYADPIESTIQVYVNESLLPKSGWTYNATSNSIVFNPGHTPPSGASIKVAFDPKEIVF